MFSPEYVGWYPAFVVALIGFIIMSGIAYYYARKYDKLKKDP